MVGEQNIKFRKICFPSSIESITAYIHLGNLEIVLIPAKKKHDNRETVVAVLVKLHLSPLTSIYIFSCCLHCCFMLSHIYSYHLLNIEDGLDTIDPELEGPLKSLLVK